jgi:hypothetical protein
MKDELKRIWKEAIYPNRCTIPAYEYAWKHRVKAQRTRTGYRCAGRDKNRTCHEYVTVTLTRLPITDWCMRKCRSNLGG